MRGRLPFIVMFNSVKWVKSARTITSPMLRTKYPSGLPFCRPQAYLSLQR